MTPAATGDSLTELLAASLSQGTRFAFYHVSTPPTKCAAIFSAPPGGKAERTYCESHFLNVSVRPEDEGHAGEVLVFAIEVLVYTTSHLTTVFVSKADSTGYLALLALPRAQTSPIRAISTSFIAWLVKHRQRPGIRLVVSLFARAQDQYLFPGSVENANKHVSDDTALIKWWCKVLDPVLRQYASEIPSLGADKAADRRVDRATAQGHLIIPGFEKNDTLRFFPPVIRTDPADQKRWTHGDPLMSISRHPTAPPRCLIPHFPDDPKSRYMDELDDELPEGGGQNLTSPSSRGTGQWRSVRSLDQFWEMMSFRQECSSGRLVGFIWVVFTPPDVDWTPEENESEGHKASLAEMLLAPKKAERAKSPNARSRRRKLTGPIVSRMPRIKSGSSNTSSTSQSEESKYYVWPSSSRGQIVLDEKDYKRATELLLNQNYANHDIAVVSSRKWITEVAVLGGSADGWGRTVVGKMAAPVAEQPGNGTSVNTLNTSIMRKKRKPEIEAPESAPAENVNTLSTNLVRKKPKPDAPSGSEAASEGVNDLSRTLVRKKPKT